MLNTNQPLFAVDQETSPPGSSPSEMADIVFGFLRRRYVIILCASLVALASAAFYVFTTPRSFTAQASLLIDTRRIQVFDRPPLLGEMNMDFMAMESQLQLLRSDNVALAVIRKLNLTEDPEFVGSKGGARNLLSISSFVDILKDTLKSSFVGILRPARPSSESELTQAVLEAFQKRLTVTRMGSSSVIEIKFQSTDPERAAQIANEIGETYIADQLVARRQTAEVAGAWLQNRLPELRAKSLAAEQGIVDFKAKNNIIAATGGQLISDQQLAELNRELVVARGRTSEARARLDRIQAVLRAYVPGSNNPATVTDTLNNPIITQ
ncbi:MAG: GumC family protein, partial [Rhodoplanes sp.]